MSTERASFERLLAGEGGQGALPEGLDVDAPMPGAGALFEALERLEEGDAMCNEMHTGEAAAALLGFAPQAAVWGCWLSPLVKVKTSHRALGAACLDALFAEHGEGEHARHRGNLYLSHLASRGIDVGPPAALVRDARLREADFALAVASLRMARLDDTFAPELLGYHTATVVLGAPAHVRRAGGGRFVTDRESGGDGDARARQLAARCLEALGEVPWQRVFRGAMAYAKARRAFDDACALDASRRRSAWDEAAAVIASKAPHAAMAHRGRAIGGLPLDALFADGPLAVLGALARSRWVVPGRPDRSPLLGELVSFDGPMFGIFSADELGVLGRWVEALPAEPAPPAKAPPPRPAQRVEARPPAPAPRMPPPPELFRRLLTGGDGPATRALARAHVERSLTAVEGEASVDRMHTEGLLPASAEALGCWVERRMVEQATRRAGPLDGLDLPGLLRRRDVLFLLTQLAPSAYIDGAWLEGVTGPGAALSAEASLLLRIYRDELGAGVLPQHHGNVMRETLRREGVTLPELDDEAFCRACLPEAYGLPALWLSFSLCSKEHMPELLGLNLAIEMAGVGDSYLTAQRLLTRHGVDATFFRLHNSVDNAASGHTAWSRDAIAAVLDRARPLGAADAVMRRVFLGHALYDAANRPLLRAVGRWLVPRLGAGLVRRLVGGARGEA